MYENKRVFLPISTWSRVPKVGVFGHNALGKAIEKSLVGTNTFIADPSFGVGIDNMMDFGPDIVFICEDVKLHDSKRQNASLTEDAFLKLMRRTKSAVVLCSSMTPDILERICNTIDDPEEIGRFLYWPHLGGETNVVDEFKNPNFLVIGGRHDCVNEFRHFMNVYTDCILPTPITCNPLEAAYVKCALSNFAALRVSFFNEIYESLKNDVHGKVTPNTVLKTIASSPIVGRSFSRVPYNGKRGFDGQTEKLAEAYRNYTVHSTMVSTSLDENEKYNSMIDESNDEIQDREEM
jgi:UDP-glucose 6-dehydrogenase